jgi:tRNA 2-thiouridine synthesizing protein A
VNRDAGNLPPATPDVALDLRGVTCPYNFIRCKLALEEMELGQVLAAIVDDPRGKENVPRSLALDGQEVLAVEPAEGGAVRVWARKKVDR